MEQLIAAFGIDVRLIIIQAVNFGLLMVVLTYFLYTPVLKLLRERQEKIAQSLKDADAAAKAREDAEAEKRSIVAAANQEAVAMAERATAHAKEKAAAIEAEAQAKAVQAKVAAETAAAELKAKALKESEAEIAKLAILAAEKVLRDKTS